MSFDVALARMAQLQSLMNPVAAPAPVATAAPTTAPTTSFATQLQSAATPAVIAPDAPASTAGQAIVNLVKKEIGVAEQPPGPMTLRASPSSARRPPVPASGRGARTSPLGPRARRASRWATMARASAAWTTCTRGRRRPAKPFRTPAAASRRSPGDLIVWDEHIGVVESVGADGRINTIEGNSSDKVSTRSYRRALAPRSATSGSGNVPGPMADPRRKSCGSRRSSASVPSVSRRRQ